MVAYSPSPSTGSKTSQHNAPNTSELTKDRLKLDNINFEMKLVQQHVMNLMKPTFFTYQNKCYDIPKQQKLNTTIVTLDRYLKNLK